MKALVCVKRTLDANVRVRINADNSNVDLDNAKMAMNPFCEIAVEEAVRLKEQGKVTEIVAVTIGDEKSVEQLRNAMALGADRSILITTQKSLEPLHIAKLLQKMVEKEQPDLLILGKQSVDSDNNQTAQMLAALCGYSLATYASKVEAASDQLQVTCETDKGEQVLALSLPAVISTDLRLNEPRYARLPDIMKAKKKPVETIEAETLGIDLSPRTELLNVAAPESRGECTMVTSAAELVHLLKEQAGVIQG